MRRLVALGLALVAAGLGAAPAPAATGDALRAQLARDLRAAGGSSGAHVVDLATGSTVFSARADTRRIPASVEKLAVTATALLRIGPEETLPTVVLGDGQLDDRGVYRGRLYLKGFGDPTLSDGRLRALARRLAAADLDRVDGRLHPDESYFDRRRGVPSSGFRPSGEVGGPLGALVVDRGRGLYFRNPAALATRELARDLRRARVGLRGLGAPRTAPAEAVALARVESPTIARIAQLVNRPSDNFMAEMLLKALGARDDRAGSTAAGAAVVRAQLGRLAVPWQVVDGSGLARSNRVSPQATVRLLQLMEDGVVGEEFVESLPVAGRSGTLRRRMRGTAAQGRCRAKTGTLRGVSNLAGYCQARNGHTLAFAFLMNGVNVFAARRSQDRMANALARSG